MSHHVVRTADEESTNRDRVSLIQSSARCLGAFLYESCFAHANRWYYGCSSLILLPGKLAEIREFLSPPPHKRRIDYISETFPVIVLLLCH